MLFSASRILAILTVIAVMYSAAAAAVSGTSVLDEPEIGAPSAIVIDANSGDILFGKSIDKAFEPGAYAMFMTALIASEALSPDEILTMGNEVYQVKGHQITLQNGEEIAVIDLLYATLFICADDAALGLAKGVTESLDDFVILMNEKAVVLGCSGTTFKNPRGLPEDGQATTARDLAKIVQAVMKSGQLQSITSQAEYTIPATNTSKERPLSNQNYLSPLRLDGFDPDVVLDYGVKGHTQGRGQGQEPWMITTASDSNGSRPLIVVMSIVESGDEGVVTSGSSGAAGAAATEADDDEVQAGLYNDADSLLNYGWARMDEIKAAEEAKAGTDGGKDNNGAVGGANTAPPPDEEKPGFLEAIGLAGFRPDGISFYLTVGVAIVVVLVIVLLIVLIRHRYTHDPYVKNIRYGRSSHVIKRVRKIK